MALSDSLTLNDKVGTAHTFQLVERTGLKSTRLRSTTGLDAPGYLTITHSTEKVRGEDADRHLIKFSREVYTMDSVPRKFPITVNFTVVVPRLAGFSDLAADEVAFLIDLLTDGTMTSYANRNNITDVMRNGS